jgi:hypothetical protein
LTLQRQLGDPGPDADHLNEPYKSGVIGASQVAQILKTALGIKIDDDKGKGDQARATIIHILRWKDKSRTSVAFQKWYVYDPGTHGPYLYAESSQKLFEGTSIAGRKNFRLVYIHFNADPTKPDPGPADNNVIGKYPVTYTIGISKQQTQFVQDLKTLVGLVLPGGLGGGEAVSPTGYWSQSEFESQYSTSTITVTPALNPQQDKGTGMQSFNTQTVVSGSTIVMDNKPGATMASFEEKFSGNPSNVSVVISGCGVGGTCDVLDTYTIPADSVRAPVISMPYDHFTIAPTLNGGSNPALTVTATLVGAASGGGSSGPTIKGSQSGDSNANTASKQLSANTYTNERPSYVGLSFAVPVKSYKDVTYQSSSGMLAPSSITQQNVYATFDLYLPPALPSLAAFRWFPHPFAGLPIKGKVLQHTMAGVAFGLPWFEPFAGVVFDRQNASVNGATQRTTFKTIFGFKVSVSAVAKALKKTSKGS